MSRRLMLEATDFERSVAKAALVFIKAFPYLKKEMIAATKASASASDQHEFYDMWYSSQANRWGTPPAKADMKKKGLSDADIGVLTTRIKESHKRMTRAKDLIENVLNGNHPIDAIHENLSLLTEPGDIVFEKNGNEFIVWVAQGKHKPSLSVAKLISRQLIPSSQWRKDSHEHFYPAAEKDFGPVTVKSLQSKGKEFAVRLLGRISDYPVKDHNVYVKAGVSSDLVKLT